MSTSFFKSSMTRGQHPEQWLGYAGLIPFVWLSVGLPQPLSVSTIDLFTRYSAIILAFMAGTLWRTSSRESLFSNVLALAAVASLLLGDLQALWLLMALYLVLVAWEWQFLRRQYSAPYWRLRLRLTAVVVIAHAILITKVMV